MTTPRLALGVAGGLLAALSYAGTTLLARFAVPRYGVMKVLLLERGWVYLGVLVLGTVILANVFFFSATRRIEAAPTAVAATIEPVVATLMALALFAQGLSGLGWLGLLMVVGGVAAGYLEEARVAPASTGQAGQAAPLRSAGRVSPTGS